MMDCMGDLNIMKTIMMEKIWSELPVMYMPTDGLVRRSFAFVVPILDIPIRFMGSCFAGARAISHAFFTLSVSISSVVGGFRGLACFEEFF